MSCAELPVNVQVVVWDYKSFHERKDILRDAKPALTQNFLETSSWPGL